MNTFRRIRNMMQPPVATHNTALAWLRTPVVMLIALLLALAAQIPHAADVFRLVIGHDSAAAIAQSYTYAIALEVAVLLFVVHHKTFEAYTFAAFSIAVNLSYYHLHGIALFETQALPVWLVSIALPFAIARYSHAIAQATDAADVQAAEKPVERAKAAKQPNTQPALETPHSATPAQPQATEKMPASERRPIVWQLSQEGLDNATIAERFGVSASTITRDLQQYEPEVNVNGTA